MSKIDKNSSDAELMAHLITAEAGSYHLSTLIMDIVGRCIDARHRQILDVIKECRQDNFITPGRALETTSGLKIFAPGSPHLNSEALFVSNGSAWYSFIISGRKPLTGNFSPNEILVYRWESAEAANEAAGRPYKSYARADLVFSTRMSNEHDVVEPSREYGGNFAHFPESFSVLNEMFDHFGLTESADAAGAGYTPRAKNYDGYPESYIASLILTERICKEIGHKIDDRMMAKISAFSDEVIRVEAPAILRDFEQVHSYCMDNGFCDRENRFCANDGDDRGFAHVVDPGRVREMRENGSCDPQNLFSEDGGSGHNTADVADGVRVLEMLDQHGYYLLRDASCAHAGGGYVVDILSKDPAIPAKRIASFRRRADGTIVDAKMAGGYDLTAMRNWNSFRATLGSLQAEADEIKDLPTP